MDGGSSSRLTAQFASVFVAMFVCRIPMLDSWYSTSINRSACNSRHAIDPDFHKDDRSSVRVDDGVVATAQ